jgi:hypothetical protein
MMRCPFCHDGIERREEGVRCARCQAPHHRACFEEHGKCSIWGCGATKTKALEGVVATARVVIAAGKGAVTGALRRARQTIGGKSVVALFLLSCAVTGLGLAPFLYRVHASRKVEVEVVLASLFVILAAWIAALLYRGVEVEHDLALQVGEKKPGDYFFFMRNTDMSGCSGCGPGSVDGCATGTELDAILGTMLLILVAAVVILVVLPLVAWLAVEVLYPCAILAIYFTLYGALAFAVNGQQEKEGRLLPCVGRAVLYSAIYTGMVTLLMTVSVRLFHAFVPPH